MKLCLSHTWFYQTAREHPSIQAVGKQQRNPYESKTETDLSIV